MEILTVTDRKTLSLLPLFIVFIKRQKSPFEFNLVTAETYFFLFITGLCCGAINAISGGSSLLSFPVLISTGLPANIANASNFLATMPGYAAAIPFYRKEFKHIKQALMSILLAGLLGAITGSLLLLVSSSDVFIRLTPYLLLIATLLYALGDSINQLLMKYAHNMQFKGGRSGQFLVYVFSIYGGFFGAGMGIIMLSLLRIMGYRDFHQANAIKNLMITLMSLISVSIFILGGLIAWPEALTMMLGSAIGGYQMVKYANRVPQKWLRYFIITLGLGFSSYYFLKLSA
jgi:uncharacterized membrane protein YfcA